MLRFIVSERCSFSQWKCKDDNEVTLFVDRVIGDWDKKPANQRKPLLYKDAINLHQASGAFIHYHDALERGFPAKAFPDASTSLRAQFLEGYLDPDLLHSLNTSVPPGDMKSIGSFRLSLWYDVVFLLLNSIPFVEKDKSSVRQTTFYVRDSS